MNRCDVLEIYPSVAVAESEAANPETPAIIVPDETIAGDGLTVVMGSCPDVIACLRNGGCLGPCTK